MLFYQGFLDFIKSGKNQLPLPSVPDDDSTKDYYESTCEGYLEFQETLGEKLPRRLQIPLELAKVQPGELSLDIGCGRGEILLHCVLAGSWVWGLDYAPEALKLARQAIVKNLSIELNQRVALQRCSAIELPFADCSVDLVFMLDVVEHLPLHELEKSLEEVWRVLKPGDV